MEYADAVAITAARTVFDIRQFQFDISRTAVIALAAVGCAFHLAEQRIHLIGVEAMIGAAIVTKPAKDETVEGAGVAWLHERSDGETRATLLRKYASPGRVKIKARSVLE